MRGPAGAMVLVVGMATSGLAGCGGRPAQPSPEPRSRVAVLGDSGATAVALALVFPGSGWELPGTEGLTLLTAETLLEEAAPSLARLGARAAVDCGRAAFTFTLVAAPEEWEAAADVLLDALFRPDPSPGALDRARRRLTESLTLDVASPTWQARLAIRQALYGESVAGSPWTVPACGIPEILPLFDLAHIRAGAYRFAPRLAHAAVVGMVEPSGSRARLDSLIPPGPAPPLPGPGEAAPGRRYAERNTVTAWTAVAFPFRAGADEEAVRFLGALLEAEQGPHVSRPDVLAIDHELERHGDGGALILHLVTTPAAAGEYADRVESRIRTIAEEGLPARVSEPALRRYRGRRLLEREAPEARAAAVARSLAAGVADVGDGWPDVAGLTPARVRAAAAALGPPARSVVGPRSARAAVLP